MFVFQALQVLELENYLLVLFCVEVLGFLEIFILCASLSLNLESMKNASWKDCLLEKKPPRKNSYSTFCISVIPPMKINPHQEQNSFQPQTVYHYRSI